MFMEPFVASILIIIVAIACFIIGVYEGYCYGLDVSLKKKKKISKRFADECTSASGNN